MLGLTQRRACIAAAVAVALAMLLGAALTGSAEGDTALDDVESEFLTTLNAYRVDHSLPPLTHDPRLAAAADWLANDQADHDYVGHTDTLGRAPTRRLMDLISPWPYSGWAENVAGGFATAQRAFEGWKNSPPHDANMKGDFNAVGVARVCKPGTTYGCYWAVNFGKTDGPIPTTTPSASPTPSDTPSPSVTLDTPAPSETPSDTPSASGSPSPSPTESATPTATPAETPAPSPEPTDSASPSPTPTPPAPLPTGAPRDGGSILLAGIPPGGAQLDIGTAGALGLRPGDMVIVNRGGPNEEVFLVSGLPPLLSPPAAFAHEVGETVEQVDRGDADCDGTITGNDIVAAIADAADAGLEERCQPLTDADCDGQTAPRDALWVALRAAGIAAFEAAGCTPVGGGFAAATLIESAAPAGATIIDPVSQAGFQIGDTIRINPGGPNEEETVITDIGSFVLQSPLQFAHEAGEPIVLVLDVPDLAPGTPTPLPSPEPTTPPTPADTPGPSESPTPTDTPAPTGTAEPSSSPSPTGTEEPSDSPSPTDTPSETDTPVPTPTPEPSDTPTPG